MSAAAARRRKQLAAKKAQAENGDPVLARLSQLLENSEEEATAYEALQLAQSQVRKGVKNAEYGTATKLACDTSIALLEKGRVSVASQLIAVLVEVLAETHTVCTNAWIANFRILDGSYRKALDETIKSDPAEHQRLGKLHLDLMRRAVKWSDDLGKIRYGHTALQELVGEQSWRLSKSANDDMMYDEEEATSSATSLKCDAIVQLALAEKPDLILEKLKSLPAATTAQTKMGHTCPAADRDALLTRAMLAFIAMENLRDANSLLREFIDTVETRDMAALTKSYMDKKDGKAPPHVIFCCMLLRTCEKDARTGPLFSWLLRSFKTELELLYKPSVIQAYTTKIGKIYFDIQPPPNMLNMMENMMGMMGGAGGMGGMNPAMMQAAMQQMQGGQF